MRQFVRELRRTWTSRFQDYHILRWSNCRAPTFENWFRLSRTFRIDKLFNETYNRVNCIAHYDWNWSNRRNLSPNGRPFGWRPHPPFNSTRNCDHRSNWWIRSNKIGSDTMPIRQRDLIPHKHCLPCDSEKIKKMKLNAIKDGRKAIPRFGGTGKDHGGLLILRKSSWRRTQHRLIRETWQQKWLGHLFEAWFSEFTRFVAGGSFIAHTTPPMQQNLA